jgi:hypothetical protein
MDGPIDHINTAVDLSFSVKNGLCFFKSIAIHLITLKSLFEVVRLL